MTTSSVITSWSTMPFAIVAATSIETKAPAKLSTAALATAARGLSARVETLVAIEFAVSWKPFVKSKKSATATTAQSVSSTSLPYAFFMTMFVITFAAVCSCRARSRAGRRRPSSGSPQRVDAVVAEERGEALPQHPVALVLEPLQLDERVLDTVKLFRLSHASSSCSAAATISAVCWMACFVGSSTP